MSSASTPSVSIVIPAYQAERFVGAALSSALTQTYPRCEVVVTDDRSTDRTREVLAAYGDLVRVVSQPNQGPSAARNHAIREARGELICLLDADDLLAPPHVEAAVQAYLAAGGGRRFVSCDAGLLTSAGWRLDHRVMPGGMPTDDQQRMAILQRNVVSIFALFPRAMWEELGGFDESMRSSEDYDFWARAIFAGWRLAYQPVPHALYRRTEGSASTHRVKMYAGEQQTLQGLLERYADDLTPHERAYIADRLASGSPQQAMDEGDEALRRGDVTTAAARFRDAARLLPFDRRIGLKATLLTRVPAAGRVYGRRLAGKDRDTTQVTQEAPTHD